MKAPLVLHSDQKANIDKRLRQTCTTPGLENRILVEAASALTQHQVQYTAPSWTCTECAALQPTTLSSTKSSYSLSSSTTLSSIPTTSSLLSTKNTLLKEPQLHLPVLSSLTSISVQNPVLPSSKMSSASAIPPVCSYPSASVKNPERSDDKKYVVDRDSSEEALIENREEFKQVSTQESLEEDDEMSSEVPVLDMDLDGESEQLVAPREEFGAVERSMNEQLLELKEQKNNLLSVVCCSLVHKNCTPGQKEWDTKKSVWSIIRNLASEITTEDPEFVLKVAVYTRQELNIRITANFLLALAANLPASKPHLRRYFRAAVQLPSDWLEVARFYSMCFSKSLPACLKKALVDKFKDFTEYQLAKYNTRKHRCKHSKKKNKIENISPEDWKKWGELVKVDDLVLKKYLTSQNRAKMDKKQSQFSLKKMIKRLHIKESAEMVMAILGKKYPNDVKAFSRSGLTGVWDRERAGKQMKLKQPDTWERKLSQEGNKAATWEKLIDEKSLPFMAMLRNLRNLITVGISQRHHAKILNRLTSKNAVIKSRQFPFRFLSAYKAVLELYKFASGPSVKPQSSSEILRDILKKLPRTRRYRQNKVDWEQAERKKLRITMRVPFVYRLFNVKRKLLRQANRRLYTQDLLKKYCCALEKAIQISCKFNIPPLPGCSIFICNITYVLVDMDWKNEDVCLPPKITDELGENEQKLEPMDLAMLLCMMMKYCSEDSQIILQRDEKFHKLKLKADDDDLLENVRQAMELVKVDRIVVFERYYDVDSLMMEINNYRLETNQETIVMDVQVGRPSAEEVSYMQCSNTMQVWGFSEQILKFVSERGSLRMLQHVENIDKVYNIPPPQEGKSEPERSADIVPLPATPKFRWKGVRVFISSTFRDMHAERDVLVRSVFPELRRRAATHYLYLQEVELRWGVTEEESNRAVELCLSEVCRSQLLIGILGQRYGLVPVRPSLPELPQYSWLNSTSDGLSITEMEIRQFQALYPDSAQSRMFFYFRSSDLTSSVPVAWRADFVAESKEAEAKMNSLKSWIRNSEFKVTENYPCEWGGVTDGKPYVKRLEEFGRATLEDIWEAVQQLFVQENDEESTSEITEQEVHQGAQHRQFHGRAKLVSMATEKIQEAQLKGGILMVEGKPGEGKTVFMSLKSTDNYKKAPLCDVIIYSTDASQSACSVDQLLRCLIQWLRNMKDDVELPPKSPASYKDLLSDFLMKLKDHPKEKPLVLFVDGADRIHDDRGQKVSEWIPQHIPKSVCLVLSVTSDSHLQNTLSKKKGTISFPLGQLSLPDKKEIVQKKLVGFGKKLSDAAFNNQLQTLLMKKGSVSPLYLHMACEELRSYASFEKMKEILQSFPQSLGELVQHSLLRLESEYCSAGIGWTLATLAISSNGGQVTWQETLHIARHPESRVPMAVFSQLARTLHSLIGASHSQGADDLLTLTHPEVKSAFEHLYLSSEESRRRSHLIMAAHIWMQSNPQGKDMFLQSDAESLSHLPGHLMSCNQWEPLCFLLSNYYFVYANVRHGLLHQLMETYILFSQKYNTLELKSSKSTANMREFEDCLGFLKRHSHLFSQWPALFVQTALNEPGDSSAHLWAASMSRNARVQAVKWMNYTDAVQTEVSELVSIFQSEPSCVVLSPDGQHAAIGTGEGTIHLLDSKTGQEVKSFTSNTDGISGCIFLEEVLVATSFDGQLEVWDVASGCRIALITAHSNKITGCDASPDRKLFATVSLDLSLKVWSAKKNSEVACLGNPTPLNCVKFDPEGQLLAVGCWDGTVSLWNWLEQKNVAILLGHQSSVRSLSFSPSSSILCSGCISGEVRLWSVAAAACVGSFHAHCGSTQSLSFLQGGNVLLSAGQDREKVWASDNLQVSMLCLMWMEGEGGDILLSGGMDHHIRVWERQGETLAPVGSFDNFTIALWLKSELTFKSLTDPTPVSILRGHNGGVTCLAFSPNGKELLSGGKDQALMIWNLNLSHPALSQSIPHCHGDWITGCAWTSSAVLSCSSDCKLRVWDVQTGNMLREILSTSSLTSMCLREEHVLAGSTDGLLMVWKWESGVEVTRMQAHKSRLNHCSVVTQPETPQTKKGGIRSLCFLETDDLLVCGYDTGRLEIWHQKSMVYWKKVSEGSLCSLAEMPNDELAVGCIDCSVCVWRLKRGVKNCIVGLSKVSSYKLESAAAYLVYCCTLFGACMDGRILDVISTASETKEDTCWSNKVHPIGMMKNDNKSFWMLGKKRSQLYIGLMMYLGQCSSYYLNMCEDAVGKKLEDLEYDIKCREDTDEEQRHGQLEAQQLEEKQLEDQENQEKQLEDQEDQEKQLKDQENQENKLGDQEDQEKQLENHEAEEQQQEGDKEEEQLEKPVKKLSEEEIKQRRLQEIEIQKVTQISSWITAAAVHNDLFVCGDLKGNIWFNKPPDLSSWTERKPAHTDKVKVLRLTESLVISGSSDRTIKLWDRCTKKQVGMFVCGAPVRAIEVNPRDSREFVCGDSQGQLYFLSWKVSITDSSNVKMDHEEMKTDDNDIKASANKEMVPETSVNHPADVQSHSNHELSDGNEVLEKKDDLVTSGDNPKNKVIQKKSETQNGGSGSDLGEPEGTKKSLIEWLEEFRSSESQREEEDLDGLMDWWNNVEQWEDMPKNDNLTEKEEAKAFAGTAEKVQKGIRLFNKLFSERAEALWQHVIDLYAIADGLDRFNKKTKIAQITGGSTSAVGGVATITGLILAPFTMGTSLIVTAVGLGVAMAGGLTSASAGISSTVNNSLDRKKVERIVEDYQAKMGDLNKCMKFIKQGLTNLRKFNLNKMKKHAYNRDFPCLDNIYEDGAMASKAILSNANEIMRVMQLANAAGTTAARAVQIASISSGVLTGLFVGMDIYFVAKDSHELKNGAKSEFAAKIREVAEQLQEGLMELNIIREEMRMTATSHEKPLDFLSLNKTQRDSMSRLSDGAGRSAEKREDKFKNVGAANIHTEELNIVLNGSYRPDGSLLENSNSKRRNSQFKEDTSDEDSPPLHIKLLAVNDHLLQPSYNNIKVSSRKPNGTLARSPKPALRFAAQTQINDVDKSASDEEKALNCSMKSEEKFINNIHIFNQHKDQEHILQPMEIEQPADSTFEILPVEIAPYPTNLDSLETDEDGDLMDWWKTVEGWSEWNETTHLQEDDEKLAVEAAADRVFMAARLFVSLFNQRGVSLQCRIVELLALADAADNFHKKTVGAAVGGGVASVAGGIATITGLILAPFTFGTSTIVTAVGISVATAGTITSATANITDAVQSKTDRKKVEKMIQDYQNEINDIRDCLEFMQEGMNTLQEWEFKQYSESVVNASLNRNIKHVMKEGGRAGRALMVNTDRLISTVKVLGVAGGAAKAAKAISITTGVMSTLFLALDVFFLAKDSNELRKGAKTKFASKIREVCKELQHGLLELNKVKAQLQKTMDGIEVEEYEQEMEEEDQSESDPVKLALLEQELDQLEEKLDKKVVGELINHS
ncbi:hypothetical protein DNTS_016997 [Danionella cerebrum]|uniref:TROVE domain-containing protein n=1 Tax=Danionella cerebrum TaxID=2873325 RepID=A0A553R9V1_9TELE|nr:hypothetical protein DNTS_016997 [Danionella translucida]